MVVTGFNSSEADGMSGIGAQFKTPEQKHEERPPEAAPKHQLPKPVPVQKPPEAGKKTVETTTVAFPVKFEAGMRNHIAVLERSNVPKSEAGDLGAMSRYVTRLLNNPAALAGAIQKGDVRMTIMLEEKPALAGREPGEQEVKVALGKPRSEVRYVNAGPAGAQKEALLKHLDYLAKTEKPAAFAGVVVR